MIIGKTRTNQPVEGGQEFEDALLDSETSLENVVDADGHKRFIEGTMTPNAITGITYTYSKWSLSGSHLMIVLAFTAEAGTEVSSQRMVTNVGLPEWILDKIYPLGTIENIVSVQNAMLWEDNATPLNQNMYGALAKESDTILSLVFWGEIEFENKTYGRYAFDLLIDNE